MPSKWLTIGLPIIIVVIILAIVLPLTLIKPTKYDCDSTGACVKTTGGRYTDSNCGGNCSVTPTVTKYDCDSTGACNKSPTGKYTVSNCNSQCVIPPFSINNPVMQVAVMDYNQFEANLENLIPFITKYVPNKILWKTAGPDCSTATASMAQHIAAMVTICASYKSKNLPYPNVALFPDLSDTSCFFGPGQDKKDASVL